MDRLPKYERWLQKALELLSKDFFAGEFHPACERDVQCHLYSCLRRAKQQLRDEGVTLTSQHRICAELPAGPDRIDLAVYKNKRTDLRLLIEIKVHGRDSLTTDKIASKVKRDIKKMRSCKKKSSYPKSARNPVVLFFFTGAKQQRGLGEVVAHNLDALRDQYAGEDVTFEWGPRLY